MVEIVLVHGGKTDGAINSGCSAAQNSLCGIWEGMQTPWGDAVGSVASVDRGICRPVRTTCQKEGTTKSERKKAVATTTTQ